MYIKQAFATHPTLFGAARLWLRSDASCLVEKEGLSVSGPIGMETWRPRVSCPVGRARGRAVCPRATGDGLGRLSISEGGVVERGVTGPPPFRNFSWFLRDAGDVKDLRGAEGGEEDVEEKEREEPGVGDVELTLMCAPSDRLKHGIFSRLTTGKDTLEKDIVYFKI